MSVTILDLDKPATWDDSIRRVVYADNTWPALLTAVRGECEKYRELHHAPQYVADPLIKTLRTQCEGLIRTHYSHFAAYHACRTLDPNKYRQLGILTSSRERLTAQARDLFGGIPNLAAALNACDSYFETYNGSVSLYATALFAPTCYLSTSHYLAMVARELGPVAQDRLERHNSRGRPFFIKCILPLAWLDDLNIVRDPSLHLYSTSLIKKLTVMKSDNIENYPDTPFALVMFRPVPPDCVDSVVEADGIASKDDQRSQQAGGADFLPAAGKKSAHP
jgi:hypothetical protein